MLDAAIILSGSIVPAALRKSLATKKLSGPDRGVYRIYVASFSTNTPFASESLKAPARGCSESSLPSLVTSDNQASALKVLIQAR
jgi:hypothetical protein